LGNKQAERKIANPNIYKGALGELVVAMPRLRNKGALPPWASRRLQALSMAPSSPVLQSIHGTADLTAFLL